MVPGLGFLGPLFSAIAAGIKAFNAHRAAANTAAKVQEKTAQAVQAADDQTSSEIGQAIHGDDEMSGKAMEKLRQRASE